MKLCKSKSFNLVPEDTKKKREVLYQPQRCSCIKFFLLPGLIGFCIMCLLFNVDFSTEDKATTMRPIIKPTKLPTLKPNTSPPTSSSTESNTPPSPSLYLSPSSRAKATMHCDNIDLCNIFCVGGFIEHFSPLMQAKQKECPDPLNATIKDCTFEAGTLSSSYFNGKYKLQSLTIDAGDLEFIYENTFRNAPVVDLETLTLLNSQLYSLKSKTFSPLKQLKDFRLENNLKGMTGIDYLEPVSATLRKARILEASDKSYDPTKWFGGDVKFVALVELDLTGNTFPDTLKADTFRNFVALEILVLQACKIESIGAKTFDHLLPNLRVLDLSSNKLQVLEGNFLESMSKDGFQLYVHHNPWNCNCANAQLMRELKKSPMDVEEEARCAQPEELRNVPLRCTAVPCGKEDDLLNQCRGTTEPTTTTQQQTSTDTTTTTIDTTTSTITTTPKPPTNPAEPSTESTETTPASIVPMLPTASTPSIPSNGVELSCFRPDHKEPFQVCLKKCDSTFQIIHESPTSVQLELTRDFPDPMDHFFIHFNQTTAKSLPHHLKSFVRWTCFRSIRPSNKIITDLIPGKAYVFCLVPLEERKISPFNCQSHFVPKAKTIGPRPWIQDKHKALFISMIFIGLVLFLVFGGLFIYYLLRCQPWLMKGSRRLVCSGLNSKEMMLLPKDYQSPSYGTAENRTSTNTELTTNSDYLSYCGCEQTARQSQMDVYLAPSQLAPPIPNAYIIPLPLNGPATLPTCVEEDDEEERDSGHYEAVG